MSHDFFYLALVDDAQRAHLRNARTKDTFFDVGYPCMRELEIAILPSLDDHEAQPFHFADTQTCTQPQLAEFPAAGDIGLPPFHRSANRNVSRYSCPYK